MHGQVTEMDKNREISGKDNNVLRYRQMGLLIAYYRKLNDYTQEELAELLEISPGYLSQVEAQPRMQPISLELLFRIADVLKIEPYRLLYFNE